MRNIIQAITLAVVVLLTGCGGGGGGGGTTVERSDEGPITIPEISVDPVLLAEGVFDSTSLKTGDGVALAWMKRVDDGFNLLGTTYAEIRGWSPISVITSQGVPSKLKMVGNDDNSYLTWYDPLERSYSLAYTVDGEWQPAVSFPVKNKSNGRCYDVSASQGVLEVVYCTDSEQLEYISFDPFIGFSTSKPLNTLSEFEQQNQLSMRAMYPRFHQGPGQHGLTWTQTVSYLSGVSYTVRTASLTVGDLGVPEIVTDTLTPSVMSERYDNNVVMSIREDLEHKLLMFVKDPSWSEPTVISENYQPILTVQWINNGGLYLLWESVFPKESGIAKRSSSWINIRSIPTADFTGDGFASGIVFGYVVDSTSLLFGYLDASIEEDSLDIEGTFVVDPACHMLVDEVLILWSDNSNLYYATVADQLL